jgi:hypothetical protein
VLLVGGDLLGREIEADRVLLAELDGKWEAT